LGKGSHLAAARSVDPAQTQWRFADPGGEGIMPRLSHLVPAVLVGVLTLAGSTLAQAPPQTGAVAPGCHSHTDLTAMLSQKFAEQPSAIGLQSNGQLVEVFVANDGTSWTIVVTRPDGWSCVVAVGENWETAPTGPLA
jgi:hypothetical protein